MRGDLGKGYVHCLSFLIDKERKTRRGGGERLGRYGEGYSRFEFAAVGVREWVRDTGDSLAIGIWSVPVAYV